MKSSRVSKKKGSDRDMTIGRTILVALITLGAIAPLAKADAPIEKPAEAESLENDVIRRSTPPATTQSGVTQKAAPGGGLDVPRIFTSLAIVIGLILLLRWGGRLLFPGAKSFRPTRAVQVLSRNVISPKQQVIVLQVGKRIVVVGDCGQQMNSLCEITDPDEVASLIGQLHENGRDTMSKSFAGLFGRAGESYKPEARTDEAPADDEAETNESVNVGLEDPALAATRQELNGLMDKVRLVARQFNRS